ncbi:M20 family metallopeptidase [Reyranella sp.]|uniref:M20 family metallopeptidase n=1 Tax=Reyranella sp. TaxID=1929291 RepID=UPI003BAAAD4C
MEDSVSFLRQLIRAQTGGEAAVQKVVADAARALGCTVETVRYKPGDVPMVGEFAASRAMVEGERESVVATFKGEGEGRSVIFFAHPDGEPLAGLGAWRRDPFGGVVDGGRIHGWGVADDLSGVAMMVDGLRALLASGRRPAGDVILASTPSKRHARGVSALLHGGLRADAAVYCHPAESGLGMREIKAFCLGQLDFRILVAGRPPSTHEISHLAFAHQAENPADTLMEIHSRLKALADRRAEAARHPLLEQAVGRSSNLLISHMNVGTPGTHTRIASHGLIEGALSLLPGEDMNHVQASVEEAVKGLARIDWVSGISGAEVPTESPLYRIVADAIVATTGERPHVNPLHTASDIRNPIVQAGIPTIGLGPLGGDLTQNGLHDEWVDVEDYRRAVEVVSDIIVGWCGEA